MAVFQNLLNGSAADSLAVYTVAVCAPDTAKEGHAYDDFVGSCFGKGILNGFFHKIDAGHRTGFSPLIMLVVGHNKQVIRIFGQSGVVVGSMPAGLPVVRVGRHRHGDFLVAGDLLPQQPDKFRILPPLLMGDVFYIYIHAVQIVFVHIFGDLSCQGFRIFQGIDACGAVPVVAEKGNDFYALVMHGFDKIRAQVIEFQASVFPDVEIAWGNRIQGVVGLVHILYLLNICACIQIPHGIAVCCRKSGHKRGKGHSCH